MPTFANLPGTSVEITDRGLQITRPPSGPKIAILGFTTSESDAAEAYVPFQVSSTSFTSAYASFKNEDGSASELCKALGECYSAGGRNIELMNILPDASGSHTNDDDRYGYLNKAYEVLYNYNADIIVPCNAPLDSTDLTGPRSFGYQLADFCYKATKNNNTCIGVVGVKGAVDDDTDTPTIQEIEDWVKRLEIYENCSEYDGTTDPGDNGVPDNYAFVATQDGYMPANFAGGDIVDAKGNKVDIGSYISVVAANLRAVNAASADDYPTVGFYNTDGVASYAGLVSSLPSKSSTTNKVLQGVALSQGVSLGQADRLAGKRFVTIIDKPKGYVVASGMTGAYNINQYYRSDFTRLTTVRIMQDAVNLTRNVSEQFIGEPNSAPQRNALSTAVENGLKAMQENGALRRFDFNIYSTPDQQVLGQATIELILVPAFELQQITVYVSLAAE